MTDQIEPTTELTTEPMPEPTTVPGRGRWIVALGAAAIVVVGVIAIVLNAGKGGSVAITPGYLPATTVAFLDARLDLPGDQREQVAALLSRFPGFADQAALDSKLADAFDRLLRQASADRYSYSADIKPWFGGRVAVAVTGLPALEGGGMGTLPVLGLISVSDATKARAEIDRLLEDAAHAGTRVASETIDGATLWMLDDPTAPATEKGHAVIALTNNMIVVGAQDALVRSSVALSRGSGETLAGSAAFSAAVGALPEARLGTLYVDGAALKVALAALAATQPGLDTALAALPERIVGSLRVADGSVILEVRSRAAASGPRISTHASTTAERVPGDSVAYVEVHDLGAAIGNLVKTAKAQPGAAAAADQLKTLEGVLGAPLESFLDWVGDAAIAVRFEGSSPGGALVALVKDTAAAQARLGQLSAVIGLATLDPSAGVHVASVDHGGTKITELTIDQAGGLKIGWALKGDLFVIGVGDGAVAWILDVTPETVLARTPGYASAVKAAGAQAQGGLVFVDLSGLRASLEALVPAESQESYQRDIRPLLGPISAAIGVALQDGDDTVVRIVLITTKQ
jgi:hypothetical protein